MGVLTVARRIARIAFAACAVATLSGCASLIWWEDSEPAPTGLGANTGRELTDEEMERVRFDEAVACVTTARFVAEGATPAALERYRVASSVAASAATEFAAKAARMQSLIVQARADAIEAGDALDKDAATVEEAIKRNFARMITAFTGMAETQPEVALSAVKGRLQRCESLYPTEG